MSNREQTVSNREQTVSKREQPTLECPGQKSKTVENNKVQAPSLEKNIGELHSQWEWNVVCSIKQVYTIYKPSAVESWPMLYLKLQDPRP